MAATRRVNVRFLGVLVGTLVVLGPSVYFVNAYQVRRNAEALKRRATQAFEAGSYPEAAKYYYLYLKQHPDDIEARIGRGEALDKNPSKSLRDLQEAFENFQYVLRWQFDDEAMQRRQDDIRRRQVDLAMEMGQRVDRTYLGEAVTHIQKLLAGSRTNDGILEQLLARCYVIRGDEDQAVTYYEKAIEHDRHHIDSYAELALLFLARRKDPVQANAVKERMLTENPDKWEAHLAAAKILRYQGEPDDGEVQKALNLAPDKLETIREAAGAAQRQHKLDEARKLLEGGLKLYPKNADLYYRLAQVEMEAGHPDKAEQRLREGLQEVPEQGRTDLFYLLAMALIQRNDIARAEKEIGNLQNRPGADVYVNDLKARIHMYKKEWSLASRQWERLRTVPLVIQQPDFAFQVERLLGLCYEQQRQPDRALECYEQALRLNPNGPYSVSARRGKASALAALGKLDQALIELRQILSKDPTVATTMVQLLTERNSRLEPDKRDWKEVDELLKYAKQATPDSTELALTQAYVARVRKNPQEALDLLKKILDKDSSRPEPWLNLIQMTENQGGDTLPVLERAEQKLGDLVDLRLARARYWFRTGTDAAPAALAKLEQALDKFSTVEQARLLDGLAGLYLRTGNINEAKRLCTKLAALQPQNVPIRTVLFELAFLSNSEQEFEPLIREIRSIEGEGGLTWRYCRACQIINANQKGKVNRDQLLEARALLTRVKEQRPRWPRVALREAELAYLEDNVQNALDLYRRALDLGEREPISFRQPIYILYRTGRFNEAERMLATLQDQNADLPPDLKRLHILLLSQLGSHPAAVEAAAQLVKRGSKEPGDHFLYATTLAQAGKIGEAEQAYRTTLQLPTTEISWKLEVWVQFVRFLVGSGQQAKAAATVQELAKKGSAEMPPFVLAQCYEALNQPDKAEEQYLSALKKNPTDLVILRYLANFYERSRQLAKAEPYLRRLLEPQTEATDADKEMARRALAVILANSGDYGKFQEGEQLLKQNAKDGVLSIPDQHALAKVYAKHSYYWRQAIDLFEKLQGQPGGLLLDEQLSLAGLYEFYGSSEWIKARKIYLNVLAANPNDATIIQHCARSLLRHDETEGMQNWLARLEKLDGPQSTRVLEIRVRLLKAQGKLEEGARLLQDYADRKDASLDIAAALLEEFGKPGPADKLYRRLVKESGRADSVLLLAAFLGRLGLPVYTQEALDLCNKAWKTCPPEKVAQVALSVLGEIESPSAQQIQSVERGLTEALTKNPNSLALLFYMAGLRSLQQQYDEAEKIYRQILQQDPRNALARNNLAWLLAARDGKPKASEALDLINQAIQLVGPSSDLLDTRAFIYLKLETPEAALTDLKKAQQEEDRKQNPSAVVYFHLAVAQEMRKDRAWVDSFKQAERHKFKAHPLEQASYDRLLKALKQT